MQPTFILNRCLAAAFTSLSLLPSSASALTLGNLTVHSHLGQPLRAQVLAKIGPDEIIDESCISLARPATMLEQFPYLTHAKLSVENTVSGQLVRIRSTQSINEPVIKLLLHVTCGGQTSLSREFTVLLDPQDYAKAAPLQQEEFPVAKSDVPAAPTAGSEWEIRSGDHLDALVQAMYPASRSKQRRIKQAILQANPLLFKDGNTDGMPAGQILKIPELPSVQHTAPIATQFNRPKKIAPRVATTDTFQLKLTTGEIDLSTSRNLTEEDRLRLREKQLLLEADDQVANILALKNRVKQLETQLNELSLRMSGQVSEAKSSKAVQPEPKTSVSFATNTQPTENRLQVLWYSLAGLAILLGTFVGLRRYKQKQELAETLHSYQMSMPDADMAAFQAEPAPVVKPIEAAAKTHSEETDYDPHSIFHMPEEKISLTEMDSVIEEADLYLIYGWTEKATDLLQNYIEKHPLELQPWMMLFDIYHTQGMKEAFDKLAPRFRENFDNPEAWKKVQALGHAISPKNPMYFSEEQQAASAKPAEVTKNNEKQPEIEPENDFWSGAKIDFRPNTLLQVTPKDPLENGSDTPLPRIKDI